MELLVEEPIELPAEELVTSQPAEELVTSQSE